MAHRKFIPTNTLKLSGTKVLAMKLPESAGGLETYILKVVVPPVIFIDCPGDLEEEYNINYLHLAKGEDDSWVLRSGMGISCRYAEAQVEVLENAS
jgi:hypothetical protein